MFVMVLLCGCFLYIIVALYDVFWVSELKVLGFPTTDLFFDLSTTNVTVIFFYWPFIYIFLFITFITLVYCFAYNQTELGAFLSYIIFILVTGLGLFYSNSLILFFFFYESFLIPAFLILYNFAKTRKTTEAAYLMFFWTQFGAIFLILNFQYLFFITNSHFFSTMRFVTLSNFEMFFLFSSLIIGFGVKFPIWPFYDWLPKAHVEASTNFSIFLSGVLVKFAFFGFIKYLSNLSLDLTPVWVYPFILVGFIDASSKVYYQTDLKKLIAYATVIEMHWLLLAVISGTTFFWIAGFAIMISHAIISSNFFLVIDSITRRYKTRLSTEISGIFFLNPSLYFVILVLLVIFLGFPGSLLFIAEFMFFSALLDLNFILFYFILFVAYFIVPSCFFKSWFLLLFGFSSNNFNSNGSFKSTPSDLDTIEFLLLWFSIIFIFWLGFTFQFFF